MMNDIQVYAIIAVIAAALVAILFIKRSGRKQPALKSVNDADKQYTIADCSRAKLAPGAVVDDVFAGLYVGGAAGSAKTRGPIHKIMKHYGQYNFGTINFCYKDFELAEYGLGVYDPERCHVIAPMAPERTEKVNLLNPSYFQDESQIKQFFMEMWDNVSKTKAGAKDDTAIFFQTAAVGQATGVAWRLHQDYPKYCTMPHVAALCLLNTFEDLSAFIRQDNRAAMQASTYLASTGNQLSGVQGTISNFFQYFATPSMYYMLYDKEGHYVDLKVNRKGDPKNLFIVNDIANERVILPVVNTVMYLAMSLLTDGFSQGKTQHSAIIVDEGSKLNLQNFSAKPQALRSFGVSTLFSMQDDSMGIEAIGEATVRAIRANLTYQFFGKANDDKTAQAYEAMNPFIEVKKKSRTNSGGFFDGKNSVTTSLKEQKKFRAPDYRQLRKGEFIVVSDGKVEKRFFEYRKGIDRITVPKLRSVTQDEITANYEEILEWGRTFLMTINNS